MGPCGRLLNTSQFLGGAIGTAAAGVIDAPATLAAYTSCILTSIAFLPVAAANFPYCRPNFEGLENSGLGRHRGAYYGLSNLTVGDYPGPWRGAMAGSRGSGADRVACPGAPHAALSTRSSGFGLWLSRCSAEWRPLAPAAFQRQRLILLTGAKILKPRPGRGAWSG